MQVLKSKQGFTIIQVVVAMGLVGMVALLLMNIMKDAAMGRRSMEKNFDFFMAINTISNLLGKNETCDTNLMGETVGAGLDFPGGVIYKNAFAPPLIDITKTLGFSGAMIDSLRIKPISSITTSGRAQAELLITFRRDDDGGPRTSFGGNVFRRIVYFNVLLCDHNLLYATSDPLASFADKRRTALAQMTAACPTGYIDEDHLKEVTTDLWAGNCVFDCRVDQRIYRCDN
ncbi:hypothetical protein N9N67_12435 [Bacteriovoracaceae bacterium]|nr:hypothetical protein [Bacteriovoracaceae bacterium]